MEVRELGLSTKLQRVLERAGLLDVGKWGGWHTNSGPIPPSQYIRGAIDHFRESTGAGTSLGYGPVAQDELFDALYRKLMQSAEGAEVRHTPDPNAVQLVLAMIPSIAAEQRNAEGARRLAIVAFDILDALIAEAAIRKQLQAE